MSVLPGARIDTTGQVGDAFVVTIYLMRHADAVPSNYELPDDYRYLSQRGRTACRQAGRLLREAKVEVDVVLSSPLVRAVQTAELVAEAIDFLGEIESYAMLRPGASPNVVCQELVRRNARVLAVSHEPTVSSIAAFLVGQPGFAPFRTAQVCLFEARRPIWKLNPMAMQFEDMHIP